ncbi:hypothetical protein D9M69_701580 [compost metagenome]
MQALLAIEHHHLRARVVRHPVIGQLDVAVVVIDELAVFDLFTRLPHQQGTDRVLAHDGVKQATDLLLAPDERPLNIGQPEAAPLRFGVIQIRDDFADRQLPVLHSLHP